MVYVSTTQYTLLSPEVEKETIISDSNKYQLWKGIAFIGNDIKNTPHIAIEVTVSSNPHHIAHYNMYCTTNRIFPNTCMLLYPQYTELYFRLPKESFL